MTMTDHSAPMTWGGHIRASVILGIPLIGSHVAQMLTHITDVVMLGWYSVEALAAVVLAAQVFFVVFIVGSGFAFAVMPLAANALGAEDDQQVRRAVRMGGWNCLFYFAVMAFPLWHTDKLLLLMGQEPDLAALAGEYMRIAMWGMLPALMIMVLKSWFGALERAGIVLWATVVAALFNGLFNYALIFGNFGMPEMGARGAAIASFLTTTLNFAFLVGWAMLRKEFRDAQIFRNPFRPDWPVFREVFRLGWPISLTLLAESGLFAAATLMVGWTGTLNLAAHGIVLNIAAISFMVPLGISNVATIRIGRAVGRGDPVGLLRASRVVIWWAFGMALTSMTVFFVLPGPLVALFLDPAEEQREAIITIGRNLLVIAAAFQVVDAMQVVGLGLLRGIKDTAIPMVLAIVGYWVLALPLAYVLAFPMGYGARGVWFGLVLGLTFAALSMLSRYAYLRPRVISTATG